ncbi:MAG TPA: HIT family protein [Acidimicrobiales bacterium]|nr:HIT family protein [Acidimicrobiales bacterium]
MTHAPPGYACPFCRYAAGVGNELVGPEHVVEQTPETVTFVAPRAWGRCEGLLVIPTEHHENLYDLPDGLGAPLLWATRRAALALKLAERCDGVSTRQHNEPAGNQDVWHFHTHVFPRWHGDGLYQAEPWSPERTHMAARAERLRAAITTSM